jgi:cyclic-di-GMP-binding protein
MPSFDIVSEVDMHELNNAMDQSNREVGTRFDFKGVDASFELNKDSDITITAEADFQIQQMLEMLRSKMVKRGVDVKSLKEGEVKMVGQKASMIVTVQQGIEADIARKIVKAVKEAKLKVQTAIQGEKLRVTGKKRDDLQQVIALLKEGNYGIPLQYDNFRD